MRTHYIEVRDERGPSKSPHPRGQYEVAAVVLSAIHGENVRRRSDGEMPGIAVAFPGLVNDKPFPMGVVRAFGTADEIRSLARGLRGTLQAIHRRIAVGEVEETGETQARNVVAFFRDRRADRETVGFNDRALRRAQRKAMQRLANGEDLKLPPLTSGEREDARVAKLAGAELYVRRNVSLRSKSTGCGFSLSVALAERPNSCCEGSVDSYGLSRRAMMVGLPHF